MRFSCFFVKYNFQYQVYKKFTIVFSIKLLFKKLLSVFFQFCQLKYIKIILYIANSIIFPVIWRKHETLLKKFLT